MRVAVIYKEDKVFVEFPPEIFKEMLRSYLNADEELAKKVDVAFDKIVQDLKKQTLYS